MDFMRPKLEWNLRRKPRSLMLQFYCKPMDSYLSCNCHHWQGMNWEKKSSASWFPAHHKWYEWLNKELAGPHDFSTLFHSMDCYISQAFSRGLWYQSKKPWVDKIIVTSHEVSPNLGSHRRYHYASSSSHPCGIWSDVRHASYKSTPHFMEM